MIIGVDCDGVLGDFASEVVRFANLYRPADSPEWTLEDVTDFEILEALNIADLQDRLDLHMMETDFCRKMPVLSGAQNFVNRLRAMNHDVVIVTSPYDAVPNWCYSRTQWLWRHFSVPKYDVIFAKRKELVKVDVLIDDKIENLFGFRGNGILIDRPWNREYSGPFRAHNYDEALARVRWLNA